MTTSSGESVSVWIPLSLTDSCRAIPPSLLGLRWELLIGTRRKKREKQQSPKTEACSRSFPSSHLRGCRLYIFVIFAVAVLSATTLCTLVSFRHRIYFFCIEQIRKLSGRRYSAAGADKISRHGCFQPLALIQCETE